MKYAIVTNAALGTNWSAAPLRRVGVRGGTVNRPGAVAGEVSVVYWCVMPREWAGTYDIALMVAQLNHPNMGGKLRGEVVGMEGDHPETSMVTLQLEPAPTGFPTVVLWRGSRALVTVIKPL